MDQDLHAVMFVQNAYASHGPMILTGLGPHENKGSGVKANQGFINFADLPCYGVEKYGVNPAAGGDQAAASISISTLTFG